MSDEERNPDEMTDEELEVLADSVPAPDEYPEGQAEELKERVEDDAGPIEKATIEGLEVSEDLQETGPVKAFDTVITAIEEEIERVGAPASEEELVHTDLHEGDTTVFMGKEYDIPIYTSVFIALGVLTIIEVIIAEIITSDIKIPVLVGMSIAKAVLVVLYYMHLKTDGRLVAVTLVIPLVVALLSALFLLGVPAAGS